MSMAGRILTPDELWVACQGYAKSHDLEPSRSENGSITLMPGDILVSLRDGKMQCGDPDIALSIMECLPEVTRGANLAEPRPAKTNMPMPARNGSNGAMIRPGSDLTVSDILNCLCPGASEKEALIAVNVCKARGMNPWGGDVHFIKYGSNPLTIVAGKEHFTKKAEANPQFDGFQAGIIVKGKDGYQELEGTFYTDEELVGGWAKVWRKDRKEPFVQKVRRAAFDTGKAQWSKMPEVMIRKCALVNALREAFPGDLGGVYDSSEMSQAIDADFEVAEA